MVQAAADGAVVRAALDHGDAVGPVLGGDSLPFDVEVEPLVVLEVARSRSYVAPPSWSERKVGVADSFLLASSNGLSQNGT